MLKEVFILNLLGLLVSVHGGKKYNIERCGSIRHDNGLCVHPLGGRADSSLGTPFVLSPGCGLDRIKVCYNIPFSGATEGDLQHVSGHCLVPASSTDTTWNNMEIVLAILGLMSDPSNDSNVKNKCDNRTMVEDYIPGSSLAAVDAKIAELDAMFKKLCNSAGRALAYHLGEMPPPEPSPTSLIKCATVDAIASHLKNCKNVLVLTGAGISTSAGIPDFRTPGSGVYDNVQKYLDKYHLQSAQKLFSYELFQQDPEPFYALAREMKYPNANVKPTIAHHFIKLLSDKGVLLRNYTQNIDMLQSQTGIPDNKVFEVHGSFRSGTCMKCAAKLDKTQLKEAIFCGEVAKCMVSVEGNACGGVIKPDIVMFGEALPQVCTNPETYTHMSAPLFFFDHPDNKTDVFMGGDIDSSLTELAKKLGWWEELEKMVGEKREGEEIEVATSGNSRPCKTKR
ncbi:hypothetical protein ACHWQZ_G003782 [Mnemiopsis leidyi]